MDRLIADNINLKQKLTRRDKEGHRILIKGSINQENTIILNTYTPNPDVPSVITSIQMELNTQIYVNTIISVLNTPTFSNK